MSTVNAEVTVGPRVYYAMAKNRAFFPSAARVHSRWHTPVYAIVAQGVCAAVMTFAPFRDLIGYIGFLLNFFAVMSVASLLYFRRREGWRKLARRQLRLSDHPRAVYCRRAVDDLSGDPAATVHRAGRRSDHRYRSAVLSLPNLRQENLASAAAEPAISSRRSRQKTLMRSLRYAAILGALALSSLAVRAQEKDIVDTAVSAGNFTTLVKAVQAAGLVDTLKGPGPFTVFAPTDEAFAKLPAGTVEGLLANPDKLKAVLTYHVVAGKVMAADVKPGR